MGKEGQVVQVRTVKLRPEKDKETGKTRMAAVPDSEEVIPADLVLIAAGFLGTEPYVAEAFGTELDMRTNIRTDAEKYETSVPRVFAAGDARRGQSLVVWAIREGREAARAVDESLMGYTNLM